MDDSIEVYITKNYLVELCDNDIEAIAASVRKALYEKPRPDDYTVADILTEAKICAGVYIELYMEDDTDTEEEYCIEDLCEKQRTKEDYWHVIKLVLEQIEVIAK